MKTAKTQFAAAALLLAALAAGAGSPSVGVTPYTFCGRVVDAAHAAFDADRSATISAYDSSTNLVARTGTFFRSDSRRNYVLDIPMATAAVDGCAVQRDQLALAVTDSEGREWSGVVKLADSVVGEPGGVKELDIVLCSPDADTHGVDADLYWSLYVDWLYSEFYDAAKGFDPNDDHDGDGVPTIAEAYAGTDPYDAESKLAIVAFEHDAADGDGLAFTARASRAYRVEGASSLESKDWKPLPVTTEGSSAEQSVVACPSTHRGGTMTVFLKPASGEVRFFRVRME